MRNRKSYYLAISRLPKALALQTYIDWAAKQRSEYNLVITDAEVTNCFSINSVLKNNNIYKRYVANIIYFTLPLSSQTDPDSVIFPF
jgi:hypothetical protein